MGTPSSMRRGGWFCRRQTLILVSPSAFSSGAPRSACDQNREGDRRRAADLDGRLAHAGALGQEIGRVDDELAGVAGEHPALGDVLDVVTRLELREIAGLRGVGRGVGLEHAAVGLVDALAQEAHRGAALDHGAIQGAALRDVGGAGDAAEIVVDPVHEAAGVDGVTLGVAEHGRARAGEERALLVGEDELATLVFEVRRRIGREAEHADQRSEGVRCVARARAIAGGARAGLGRRGRRGEAERVEEAALAGEHGVVDGERALAIACRDAR
ncbi:MAG: hypothetical protein QM820_53130 [Minicystis sp.]